MLHRLPKRGERLRVVADHGLDLLGVALTLHARDRVGAGVAVPLGHFPYIVREVVG